jgi:hypothetical protein
LRESGRTSGALLVKVQEFAPLASPGAVHYVTFVVVYRRHFEKFFYTEKVTMTKVLDPNAWEKQIRANIVDPITAAHVAGHVVARMLAYEDFGYSLDVFATYGLVHTVQPPHWVYDDGVTYPQGPITAPFFSHEMERASEELRKKYGHRRNTYDEYMAKVVQLSKAAGANIEQWFAWHVLQAVSGPIAEALASNRSFSETWGGHDQACVTWLADIADVDHRKMVAIINRMAAVSAYAMENNEVGLAVMALAKKLQKTGLLPGKTVLKLIQREHPSCLHCTFRWALRDVEEMEHAILRAKAISMEMQDRSRIQIKGHQSSKLLWYRASYAVLPETLRRAFGDDVAVEGVKAA